MGSEWTIAELNELRHKAVEEYVRVGGDSESWLLDLRALEIELDRALSPAGDPASVETRAQRVASALDTPKREPTPLEQNRARARAARHESLRRRARENKPELFDEWARRDKERDEERAAIIAAADAQVGMTFRTGPTPERAVML